jgi:tetratricopeptide (TPR) repeat protein/predicted aspartyl protease
VKTVFACTLAGLALMFGSRAAWAGCEVGKVAELPATMQGMQAMTDAKINGKDVRFVIDSGAFWSVISPGSARELGLSVEPLPGWIMRGINGDASMSLATVKTFTLSGVDIPRVQFVVAGSEVGGAGVIGQNLLGLFDTEYDLPHGAVRLMKGKGCEKTVMAYWTAGTNKAYSVVNLQPYDRANAQTVGTVMLNGVKIKATFDTGAFNSVLSMAAAARAGITPASPGVEPGGVIVGFGRKLVRTWIAPFDSFQAGDEEVIHHGRIRFGEMTSDTDMLLGADFFIAHRVYVSNSQRRLYLTYEGGPVFNLKTEHRDATGATIAEASPGESPTTAEGYSRSGAVRLAQHDRDGAIADFGKAIALAPTEPRYLLQRARVYLDVDKDAAAAADVSAAIKLRPDDVEALLARARLTLHGDDPNMVAVEKDLAAADHAMAPASDDRLDLGALYVAAEKPALAIPHYMLWIKNHADDVRRPTVLNDRCWARALAGTELPAALSDCNAALRQRPGNLSILDSRAMVELRMGDADKAIADYDAVIAKQPQSAWSLYGRGVARQKKGDAAGAKADFEAAAAVAPKLAARAKRLGITP